MTTHDSDQRGMTLMEVMIVVAIIGVIALFALPNFRSSIIRNRLLRPAGQVGTMAAAAKLEAINGHGQGVIAFHVGGVEDEFKDKAWAGEDMIVVFFDANGNGICDGGTTEPETSLFPLGRHVSLVKPGGGDPVDADGWNFTGEVVDDRIVFGATGGVVGSRNAAMIAYLGDGVGNYMRLVFNPLTGQMRKEKLDPDTSIWVGEGRIQDWRWVL